VATAAATSATAAAATTDSRQGAWGVSDPPRPLRQYVRDALRETLAPAGLVPDETTRSLAAACRDRGDLLARRLLTGLLDASTGEFGRTCAFGYDVGGMLHAAGGAGFGKRREICELTALFNVGIVVFDRACDTHPDLISTVVGEAAVRKLSADRLGEAPDEVRSLSRIVEAFFVRARRLLAGDEASLDKLGALLAETYRAQLASLDAGTLDSADAAAVALGKSQAPFFVMLELVRSDPVFAGRPLPRAEGLARDLGATFALVDDLVDIERDLERAQLNAIAAAGPVNRGAIDDAIARLAAVVAGVVETLELCGPAAGARRFRELLLAYVWSWLGFSGSHEAQARQP
jgi:hypothetical protein